MKTSMVSGPGETRVVEAPNPTVGPTDVLVKMRACGICGSDAFYIALGGLPPRQCQMPLGHEPAGEVVEVGAEVSGISAGDHVVINPMVAPSGIIGNGGATGALAEYLLIEDAVRGKSLEVVPDHIPFEVAALNEPMAVARHAVNQVAPKPFDKAVVLLRRRRRCTTPDRTTRSRRVNVPWKGGHRHLSGRRRRTRSDHHGLDGGKAGAKVAVVAVHKEPVPVDFLNVMSNEITIIGSMGYPNEIFEVTKDIVANWEKYAVIVSHTVPFEDVDEALRIARTPGAADKVVVTFS